MTIRLEIHVDEVVQIRNESNNNYHREKKSISTYRRFRFFDTTNYLYEQKDLQQLRVTKLKKGIVTRLTDWSR